MEKRLSDLRQLEFAEVKRIVAEGPLRKRSLDMGGLMKLDKDVLKEVIDFIKQINYGEVVITVHDAVIVQIEKREKKRFK